MNDNIDKEMLEIEAMKKIIEVFSKLDDATRIRVLNWAMDKFVADKKNIVSLKEETKLNEEQIEQKKETFSDLPTLFSALSPASGSDKVLVAGYWFQVYEKRDALSAQEINSALKHLGHGVSNVTVCMNVLMASTPNLVMQIRKSGTTQQSRKEYKLTAEGIKRVEEMIKKRNAI